MSKTHDTEQQQILDFVLERIAAWEVELSALTPKLPEDEQREIIHLTAGMQQIRIASQHLMAKAVKPRQPADATAD